MKANLASIPPAVLIMAVIVAVWAPVIDASFQFDDWSVIVGDARVSSLTAWWQSMPAIRPLLKLVYALGHELGGQPIVYRGFNVLVHAVNTALVFTLVRRLARRMRSADAAGATQIAGLTALLFGLHPVQTEAVTYISGGSVSLMSCFALVSVVATLRAADSERPWLASAIAIVALVAALAVRETAVVLPLACVLCWAAEDGGRHRGPRVTFVVMSVVTLALGALAARYTAYPWLISTSLDIRSPIENLFAQGAAIAWLLGQLVRWDRLNADPALVAPTGIDWIDVTRVLLLAAIVIAAAAQWRARRWLAFGVLWFFLWLAPTNSLLARFDVVNERQLYLAMLGPAWLFAHALQRLPVQRWAVVTALAMVLAGATALRNRVYVDEVTFWQDVVSKSPHNERAVNNLGMALALACQPLAADRAFDEAQHLKPDDPRPRINRELLSQGELPGLSGKCIDAGSR